MAGKQALAEHFEHAPAQAPPFWQTMRRQQSGGTMGDILGQPSGPFDADEDLAMQHPHYSAAAPPLQRVQSAPPMRPQRHADAVPPHVARGASAGVRPASAYDPSRDHGGYPYGYDYDPPPDAPSSHAAYPPYGYGGEPSDGRWDRQQVLEQQRSQRLAREGASQMQPAVYAGGTHAGAPQPPPGTLAELKARRKAERALPPHNPAAPVAGYRVAPPGSEMGMMPGGAPPPPAAPPPHVWEEVGGEAESVYGSQAALKARRRAERSPPQRPAAVPYGYRPPSGPEDVAPPMGGGSSSAQHYGSQAALKARQAAARQPYL